MSLQDELNILIGKYSIRDIHMALEKRMRNEYDYLNRIYGEKKIVKKDTEENHVVTNHVPVVKVVSEEVGSETVEQPPAEQNQKKFKDSKEQKLWQREMEEKKKKENLEKGISIKSLLTKENLTKWIEEDNRTYSYIAREYVGCKDSEVSAAAKAFGIENTRKNVMIHAKK